MPTKLFIGRIAEGTPNDDIHALFRKFGTITECDVLGNYGFVHMENESDAKAAIAALDGYSINGSHIHVELSTANTQGRKRRGVDNFRANGRGGGDYFRGGGRGGGPPRYEPYGRGGRRDMDRGGYGGGDRDVGGMPPEPRGGPAPTRDEYASEQVKDLLELYFRDPFAFDQYARAYYYGERSERAATGAQQAGSQAAFTGGRGDYYDKRPPDVGYASLRR